MKIVVLIVFLTFSVYALGQSEPVIVTMPKGVPIKTDSSKLFIVHIDKDSLTAWFNNKWTKYTNVEQLDSLIKSNIERIKQEQSIVRQGKNVPYDKLKKVADVFKENTISHFILETEHN